MSGDHFYSFRLQTGVLGALHCHVYSNNNYCHSTLGAVQILKIAYAGCKENHFYSLLFGQAEASIY